MNETKIRPFWTATLVRSSLGRKLFWSIGIPALGIALAGVVYFWTQATSVVRSSQREDAAAIAELIATAFSITDGNARGAPLFAAHRAVTEAIHSNWKIFDVVQDLRVVDRQGVIRWSRREAEEGKVFSDAQRVLAFEEPATDMQHGRAEMIRPLGGMACAGCHTMQTTMNVGALELTVSPANLHQQVQAIFQSAMESLLLYGGALVFALGLALHLILTRRLKRLADAMRRAQDGDLIVRADATGADEISRLGASFNAMLARLTAMKASEIDTHRDLVAAQEQLSLKQALETTNVKLENRLLALSLLFDMARSFTSTLELPELLNRMTRLIVERLQIPQLSIMLLSPQGTLEVKNAFPPMRGTEGLVFRVGEGACGIAAKTLKSVYLSDLQSDDAIFVSRGTHGERGSLLAVPMIHKETLLGVLNFQRPDKAAFSPEEIELLTAVADQAALAVKNAILHEETVALSITDPLTGAPNRRHLFARLEMEIARANRFGNQVSVLMIDIDHFKLLNDSAGHRAGDQVLREVFEVMKAMTRKVDTLARYGGEEFMLLLPQVTKPEAVDVAEKLRDAIEHMASPQSRSQPDGKVTISIGVANLPVDATELDKLVDSADAALYASKRGGRNKVTGYAAGMEQHPGRERGPHVQRRARASDSSS